jgi:hypothetical protein
MHLNKSDLEKVSRELLTASWGIFSWKWDHRFEAFLAEFSADHGDEFRAILERDFSKVWDSSIIREAPDIVKICDNNFGGLRSGQLLFTTDPSQDVIVCGAWWPWSDGKTISLRIASPAKELQHEEMLIRL